MAVHTGTVKWFDDSKSLGQIAPDDGTAEVMLHRTNFPEHITTLKAGQKLEYGLEAQSWGYIAIDIKLL